MRQLFFFISLLGVLTISAQNPSQQTTRYPGWGVLFAQIGLSENWSATVDIQERYDFASGNWLTQIYRPGIGRKIKNDFAWAAGLGYIRNFPVPNGKQPRPEWRPWQELSRKFKPGLGTIATRIRTEERFIREYNGDELKPNSQFHSFRCRLRAEWVYTFRDPAEKGFHLSAGDEFFVATKPGWFTAFDQNRAYAGGGYRFSKSVSLQLHYLNLFQQINSVKSEMHHVIRLTTVIELKARKRKTENE